MLPKKVQKNENVKYFYTETNLPLLLSVLLDCSTGCCLSLKGEYWKISSVLMDTSQGLDIRGSLVFKSHEGNNKIIVITIIIRRIRKNKELTKTTTTCIVGDTNDFCNGKQIQQRIHMIIKSK